VKFHHAAALLSVGWYLMAPPLTSRRGPIDRQAHLAKWETWFAFDTAAECQARVKTLTDAAIRRLKALPVAVVSDQRIADLRTLSAQCVATDDPRLKEK
jgi:hypothetical protein